MAISLASSVEHASPLLEEVGSVHRPSKTTDNCVEPTIIQSIVVRWKLSQSEVDRMVQEAEKSRDEDEVNESKHQAESCL